MAVRSFTASVPRGLACRSAPAARRVSVRAEEPSKAEPVKAETAEESSAPQEPEGKATSVAKEWPAAKATSFGDLMAFNGAAPELVNGRLAMLGFFSAVGAELSSGEGVLRQFADAPAPILATFAIIAAASFIPLAKGLKPESRATGPFTAAAEMLNGRAAMVGLVALLAAEAFTSGRALL